MGHCEYIHVQYTWRIYYGKVCWNLLSVVYDNALWKCNVTDISWKCVSEIVNLEMYRDGYIKEVCVGFC